MVSEERKPENLNVKFQKQIWKQILEVANNGIYKRTKC
jgi:hypothetical protein